VLALVALLLFGAPPETGSARLEAALTPALRDVLRPLPELVDGSREARLAWVAELGRRVDRLDGHSQSSAWRAIMGWPEGDPAGLGSGSVEALDKSVDRYPVPLGKRDPATDFAASVALAWLDPKWFPCAFPLRARYLRDHGLAPPSALDAGQCHALEAWADFASVEAIEIIYIAQRWTDAAATMGHVIFRVRRKADAVVDGPSFATVFSYVAKDPKSTPMYMFKGMTGGLTAGVKLERFGDIYARYGLVEGRDMHVYELVLSPDERRYLLAEVFAQEQRHMQIPYAFFTSNCATMAFDTLRAALPELPARPTTLVHPHEVVSMLIASHRAVARGIIPARKTRALDGEVAREDDTTDARPELALVHTQRWSSEASRAAALHALETSLALAPPSEPDASSMADYLDHVLDIESFAVDQALPAPDTRATSDALEAALAARALLPPSPASPQLDASSEVHAPIQRSGSRRMAIGSGWTGSRALLSWSTAVLAEEAGEPRVVGLRKESRMQLLDNTIVLSSGGADVDIEEERLVVIASTTWGAGVRTDVGWLESRMGFGFTVDTWSRPHEGMPFAVRVAGGPGLTLFAADDFAAHLVLRWDTSIASWSGRGDGPLLRATTGLGLEGALPLGSPLVRLLGRGRVAPAIDLADIGLEAEASLALDLCIVPESSIFLRFFGTYASGLPAGDGWTGGAAVSF